MCITACAGSTEIILNDILGLKSSSNNKQCDCTTIVDGILDRKVGLGVCIFDYYKIVDEYSNDSLTFYYDSYYKKQTNTLF